MRTLALIACLTASPLTAQDYLTGEEFEEFSTGGTFIFTYPGQDAYGIELYLPNRQVIWAITGSECVEGTWYEPEPAVICFDYPQAYGGVHQCWRQRREGDVLIGEYLNDPSDPPVTMAATDIEMPCLLPYLGS